MGVLPLVEHSLWCTVTTSQMDVSTIAQQCLRLLSIVERKSAESSAPDASAPDTAAGDPKRRAMLEGLGDPQVVIVGRVALQKRIRKHVSMITVPTSTHLMAFKEIMFRWSKMTPRVDQPDSSGTGREDVKRPVSEDERHEWQNNMCFLASGWRCCQLEDLEPFPQFLVPLLPQRLHAPHQPSDMAKQFTTDVVELLTSESLKVREAAKEALGNELHTKLLPMFFELLDE